MTAYIVVAYNQNGRFVNFEQEYAYIYKVSSMISLYFL